MNRVGHKRQELHRKPILERVCRSAYKDSSVSDDEWQDLIIEAERRGILPADKCITHVNWFNLMASEYEGTVSEFLDELTKKL